MSLWPAAFAGLVLALAAGAAQAQIAGSVALASDYRLRGFSLPDGGPALTVSLGYDHSSGAYAGGTVIGEDPDNRGARVLGHMEYVGYAWRQGGRSFDVGVNNVDLRLARGRIVPIEYTEVYAGVAGDRLSARAAFAPDYPRHGMETLYLELSGVVRPADGWRLSARAGASVRFGDSPGFGGDRTLYDLRLGVTRAWDRGELSLSWAALLPRPEPHNASSEFGFILGAAAFF